MDIWSIVFAVVAGLVVLTIAVPLTWLVLIFIVAAVLDLWESVTNRLRYRKSVKHLR